MRATPWAALLLCAPAAVAGPLDGDGWNTEFSVVYQRSGATQ